MFYEFRLSETESVQVSALVSLTPAESKCLIAKGVAALPEVKRALKTGLIIIGWGTTNAFVAEEIAGIQVTPKGEYTLGCITAGELRTNTKQKRPINIVVLRQGKLIDARPQEIIKEFGKDDIFIKGASAIDSSGQAAVLAANADGGTIGYALPIVLARGAHLIVPVGLEKLVPSVAEALPKCGIFNYKYCTGLTCALIPMPNAKVVTEIQALKVLCGVSATHVASGGIGGSEGTVILVLQGSEANIERAFDLVKAIKGESPVPAPEQNSPKSLP